MYIVGIDIAKRSHEAIIIDHSGTITRKPFNFQNSHQGLLKLLTELKKISSNTEDFTIAMESTSHYWIALYSALKKKNYKVQVINPIQSNALRNLYIRQVKSDEHDSFIIAEVVRFGRFTEGAVHSSELYELRELCRARTFIVDMCADLKKKVIALLDQVFPEYETIFTNIFGLTSTELLLNCPTPDEILAIETEKLAMILEKPSRKRFSTPKAEQIKEIAKNSFGIILALDSMSLLIKQHIDHVRFIEKQIQEIISEIGDISRFSSSAKLTAFAGIDPTINQSGEFSSNKNHMSKRGSPYLRRAIWQASTSVVMHDPNLKAFFEKKRTEGKPYMKAIGHVTRKLTSIIYAVLRDNKPYYTSIAK